jgi:hypothetical protein
MVSITIAKNFPFIRSERHYSVRSNECEIEGYCRVGVVDVGLQRQYEKLSSAGVKFTSI